MSYYTFAEHIRRGPADPEFAKMQQSYDPKRLEKLLAGSRLERFIRHDEPGTYTCWEGIQAAKDTLWNLDTGEDGADEVIVPAEIYLSAIMIYRWLTYDTCTLSDVDFPKCISIAWDIYENHPNKPRQLRTWWNRLVAAYEKQDMSQYLVETGWLKESKYGTFLCTSKFADVLGYQPDWNPFGEIAQYF